jgi:hypothetical protein
MRKAVLRLAVLSSHLKGSRRTTLSRGNTYWKGITTMAPAEPQVFEYIVIGGGSGGSGTARRAAGWYGKKTLLIENGLSGGCCVNVG